MIFDFEMDVLSILYRRGIHIILFTIESSQVKV